ncbi:MAG: serine/threonine protein kinase [Deltaproteobacteria bacterium]|nr:serine/threonine protein kinase [Deltaproteobacteria bacterium]
MPPPGAGPPKPKPAAKPAAKAPSSKGGGAKQAGGPKPTARYQLLEKVATGGMAQLWKARVVGPEGFDKLVAVKRILDTFSSNEEFVRMFIDEARLAALLNHPNVVQVFELGRDVDANLFISMELVVGVELAAMLEKLRAKRRRVPEAAALEIMVQVLRGLHHAHVKADIRGKPLHIVHRDVSPQNILVNTEGVAKLLDFGVAKARGRLTETQAGLIKGKLLYMSPEQSRNRPIDARTDQFAAALVLWECLVGEPCYTFPTEQQLLRAVALGEVRKFEDVGVPVDPELEGAIMAALSPKPEDRYETCEDFANALLRYKQRNYPSYTPTMLGQFVEETCPKEIDAMHNVPDLEGPNVQPLYVAQVDVSNLGNQKGSKLNKWALAGGGALAAIGLAVGGVAWYLRATAPPPEEKIVVVQKPAEIKTVVEKVVEYRDQDMARLAGLDLDAGIKFEPIELEDGGTAKAVRLPSGKVGWVVGLGDGTHVLRVDLEDGGKLLVPITVPADPVPASAEMVNFDDGGIAAKAHLTDGGYGWITRADGGGFLVEIPGSPEPFKYDGPVPDDMPLPEAPIPTTIESVTLEDGGTAVQAHLPDAGSGWVQTINGKTTLIVVKDDGTEERAPFTMPGSAP